MPDTILKSSSRKFACTLGMDPMTERMLRMWTAISGLDMDCEGFLKERGKAAFAIQKPKGSGREDNK